MLACGVLAMRIHNEETMREMFGEIYAIACDSAVRPEDDQDVLAEIWRVLMELSHPPTQQTRMLAYLVLSENKPKRSHEKDGEQLMAFTPFIYDDFAKNFACRKFLKSEADLLAWYSNKYGEPVEGLKVTYGAEGPSNPLTEWDNRYVFISSKRGPYPEGYAQLVGIMDGDFEGPEPSKAAGKPAMEVELSM